MKCPLFTIGRTDVQLGVESDYGECLQEACAWWIQSLNDCAVATTAWELARVRKLLEKEA